MKKIKALLMIGFLCLFVFSFAGQNLAIAAEKTNTVSLLDLVRLKKYLAGITVEKDDFDYNKDNKIDSRDLVALISRIMYPQENNDDSKEEPSLDGDGYYNEVVKP